MTNLTSQKINRVTTEEKLAQTFYNNGRYNTLFLVVTGIGFLVIYLLTRFNILGTVSPQLIYISAAVIALGLLQIPVMRLARQKKGIAANFWGESVVIFFAILLAALWQGILPVAIIIIFITPLTAISA